jgi:methylitaconate Delta-isomerase
MRGGTSRGAFLLEQDLPSDPGTRDSVILALYGSPDPRQIDGLGGADALTSKVAVVGRSELEDVDVDYTFGQVEIARPRIMWAGNCGNMLSGVAAFAVDEGLVRVTEPVTLVRIRNTNTGKVIQAEVPVAGGRARVLGDCAIPGVPGTGAPIALDFGDCSGALTGKLLPTGSVRDQADLGDGLIVPVSIVDAATPFVFVRAADLGMDGTELPQEIEADVDLSARLERVRSFAAEAVGIVERAETATSLSPSVPRVSVVSPPRSYRATTDALVEGSDVSLVVRQMAMQRPHKTYSVTGAICTSVAAMVPGTVVNEVADLGSRLSVRLGHPAGVLDLEVVLEPGRNGSGPTIRKAALLRTARRLMDGYAYVPVTAYEGRAGETDQEAEVQE